jgi:hypothetical protein
VSPRRSQRPNRAGQLGRLPPANKPQQTPKEKAWQMLESACTGEKTSNRATEIRVLGLMPANAKAAKLAEEALNDESPEIATYRDQGGRAGS